jgi:hypothetical protein
MEPDLNVPGITEFHLFDNCIIGLMPNDGIARILANNTPHPGSGTGIPRVFWKPNHHSQSIQPILNPFSIDQVIRSLR